MIVSTRAKKLISGRTFSVGMMFAHILIGILVVVCAFPYIWMILTSFKSNLEAMSFPPTIFPKKWLWSNYYDAWTKPRVPFTTYFKNSIINAVFGVAIEMLICSFFSYALANLEFKAKGFVFSLVLATMLVGENVTMIPNFLTIRSIPLAGGNNILGQGGQGFYDTYAGMILPFFVRGFSIFMMRNAFMAVPKDFWDAAQMDGMGHVGYIKNILIHLCKPTLFTCALMSFTGKWNAVLWPMLVTSSEAMRPLQVALYYFNNDGESMVELIMAASIFCSAPLIILYFFTQKYFEEGITGSGIKG